MDQTAAGIELGEGISTGPAVEVTFFPGMAAKNWDRFIIIVHVYMARY